MSAFSFMLPLLLLAQAGEAMRPPDWLLWFFVWGEPSVTLRGAPGSLLTWAKVLGLFCLLGWVFTWLVTAIKEQSGRGRASILDMIAIGALVLGGVATFLAVLVTSGQLAASAMVVPIFLGAASALILFLWLEAKLWSVLWRLGTRADLLVLVTMHVALALGFVISFGIATFNPAGIYVPRALEQGARLGVTYMALIVLLRILSIVLPEISRIRGRRLYAIAWHSWTESFRRMWAPYVVVVLFAVVLAFTAWFLQPAREAEMSRLYVGTLMLLTSILLTFTIVILAPISLPNDIRQQTIYTIVSKPTRRLEMVWGRILGYMALVTVLLLFFGVVSLVYFNRMLGAAIVEKQAQAAQYRDENKIELAEQAEEQAAQIRTRMSARLPVFGSLIFYDSQNVLRRQGIDVGIELPRRSFVEGGTPSRALWRYAPRIPNPLNPQEILNRAVPVSSFLQSGTIEWVEDQILDRQRQIQQARQELATGDITVSASRQLTSAIARAESEIKALEGQRAALQERDQTLKADMQPLRTQRQELATQIASLQQRGMGPEAEARAGELADVETQLVNLEQQVNALHSPPIPIEMTFNVYRTTKGELGEPVYASLIARNLAQPESVVSPHRDVFAIREYYTNQRTLPSRLLVGSGGQLEIEIKCLSPNQYLGMAEDDLFIVASQGSFWTNYMRGLGGVWLQAMILTAIGIFAGTFLSWPVALLATLFFFLAGNVGFEALQKFALASELVGGGPFESLIRMLTHDNLMSTLEATPSVVVAKTLDSVVMPVMSRLVYLVPNFSALDISDTVASGFAVTWRQLSGLMLLALAYALPFSIAGFFILRNREVAA